MQIYHKELLSLEFFFVTTREQITSSNSNFI